LKNEELINYWRSTSDKDFITMMNLYNSKDYHWSLFIGHLVIEKLLKAIYIKNAYKDSNQPPRTHDLLLLAKRANIDLSEKQQDILDMITTFNISVRYPDYKQRFYKKCTSEYTGERIDEIKELRVWLMSIIENR
jgi:HEPN domain-containing protein